MSQEYALPVASMQKRVLSFMIDDIVIVLFLLAIFYNPLMEISSHFPLVITKESLIDFRQHMHQFSVNNLLEILGLKVLYHTFFVWLNGMTLGKYFMKIKVISLDTNQTLPLWKALLRALIRILSESLFYLGFLLAYFIPLHQTLHDKFSSCVVIDV